MPSVWKFPGPGYHAVKKRSRCRLLAGSLVIYEDPETGKVHRRAFKVVRVSRGTVTLSGWPDGRSIQKSPVRFRAPRRSVVSFLAVMREELNARFWSMAVRRKKKR